MDPHGGRKGFSLIELVVAIAVLTMQAAIILPVFSHS